MRTGFATYLAMNLRMLAAGVFSATFLPAVAHAAVAPACAAASMFPRATSIPANLPAFGYDALKATQTDVHLYTTTGTKTEVGLTVGTVEDGLLRITPADPLVVGKSYSLEFSPFCYNGPTQTGGPIAFTVAPAAPLPTQIGTLVAPHTATTQDFGTTKFAIKGSYTVAAEMQPWLGVYDFFVTLDGRRVQTIVSTSGPGTVEVLATGWCDGANAATNDHQVTLNAKLPFTPQLQTAVAQASFNCPAPNIKAPTPSNPSVPQTQATANANGSNPTGGRSPTSGGGSSSSGGTSSCSSSVGRPGTTSFPAAFAIVGVAVLVRRRRSARKEG
jgi:hypothetical protein